VKRHRQHYLSLPTPPRAPKTILIFQISNVSKPIGTRKFGSPCSTLPKYSALAKDFVSMPLDYYCKTYNVAAWVISIKTQFGGVEKPTTKPILPMLALSFGKGQTGPARPNRLVSSIDYW
jgi:hypothetical protein